MRDEEAEHLASVQLARFLARNERDLDQAVALATSALATKDDRELRCDVASWLECLGDAALAAEALAPLTTIDSDIARTARRASVRTRSRRACSCESES